MGRHRGDKISQLFFGSEYETIQYKTIGLTLEWNAIKTIGSSFGVGLTFGGNINKEITYFSALLSLNIGNIVN